MAHHPDDDFLELPTTTSPASLSSPLQGNIGLTERQMDQVVGGGVQVATGAVEVVKTAFEIWRIREEAKGQVTVINAQTEQLRTQLAGELEKMRESRQRVRVHGDVVVDILRAAPFVIGDPHAGDAAARARFIEQLPNIIEATLKERR
jgi:hypothetical protein